MPVELVTQIVCVGDHELTIQRPAHPDRILNTAVEAESAGRGNYDPYWGLLWDSALGTARAVLEHPWTRRLTVLELGCGIGVAGVAALIAGLDVTFTDLVDDAVRLAQSNAARNGFPDVPGFTMDWRSPVAREYDMLLASDVLYDAANHQPLLTTMSRLLAARGEVWIGDSGRHHAADFLERASAEGWQVQFRDERNRPLTQLRRLQFQLFVLSRRQR